MLINSIFLKNRIFLNLSGEKKQFFMFFISGGLNTLFGYGVFSGLIFLGFHYTLAILFSTVAGVIFNFFTTGYLVFKNNKHNLFIKFLIVYIILLFLNISIVSLLNRAICDVYFNGAIATIVLAFIGFAANKHFVFREN